MSALKKTGKPALKRTRKDDPILVVESSNALFRVVVNNYKQQPETSDNSEDIGETIVNDSHGLPPQPTGYLKFPTYDPF